MSQAIPIVITTIAHSPSDEITAGLPANNSRSTSASFALSYSLRSVLQKRHLIAAALIVSPQTGHGLLSSLTSPPLQQPRTTNQEPEHEPRTMNHQPRTRLSPSEHGTCNRRLR